MESHPALAMSRTPCRPPGDGGWWGSGCREQANAGGGPRRRGGKCPCSRGSIGLGGQRSPCGSSSGLWSQDGSQPELGGRKGSPSGFSEVLGGWPSGSLLLSAQPETLPEAVLCPPPHSQATGPGRDQEVEARPTAPHAFWWGCGGLGGGWRSRLCRTPWHGGHPQTPEQWASVWAGGGARGGGRAGPSCSINPEGRC